jgi:NhaP-type Na+/H+ or K+/H+ antiporter
MLTSIDIDFTKFLLPVIIATVTVLIARTISVYIPIFTINKFKLEDPIPYNRAKLLSWGCLR